MFAHGPLHRMAHDLAAGLFIVTVTVITAITVVASQMGIG